MRLACLLVCCSVALLARPARAADCTRLHASPSATPDDDIAWAQAIFSAVSAAEARVDPSATRPTLRILAPEAVPEAGAWYCGGGDTIFVSRPLVAYAALARASDGADFLAFALAHELAHRRFDAATPRTPRPIASADQCARSATSDIEAAADHRAVFLLALATAPDGRRFTPLSLDHYASLETFLASERGMPRDCPAFAARGAAIQRALGRLAEIAALYEAALAVAFQPDGAADLAAIAAELAPAGAWDAVPELSVLRAHALVAAATRGGWCPADLVGLAACQETCVALFPRHARLAPVDPRVDVSRSPAARAALLGSARAALADARRHGLTPAELGGAEACLAFAQLDPAGALAALARVPAHPATDAARAANRRLFERQRALLESPEPSDDDRVIDAAAAAPVPTDVARDLAQRVASLACDSAHACVRLPTVELATLIDTALPAWQLACEVSWPGLADDGGALHIARCPRWDPTGVVGWTLFARGDRVVRATRVRRP